MLFPCYAGTGSSPPSQLQIARLILLKTIINRFLYAKFPLGVRLSHIILRQNKSRMPFASYFYFGAGDESRTRREQLGNFTFQYIFWLFWAFYLFFMQNTPIFNLFMQNFIQNIHPKNGAKNRWCKNGAKNYTSDAQFFLHIYPIIQGFFQRKI